MGQRVGSVAAVVAAVAAAVSGAQAQSSNCGALPNHAALKGALDQAVSAESSGLNLDM